MRATAADEALPFISRAAIPPGYLCRVSRRLAAWDAGHLPQCRLIATGQTVEGWVARSAVSARHLPSVSYITEAARGQASDKLAKTAIAQSEADGFWTLLALFSGEHGQLGAFSEKWLSHFGDA